MLDYFDVYTQYICNPSSSIYYSAIWFPFLLTKLLSLDQTFLLFFLISHSSFPSTSDAVSNFPFQ